MHCGTLAQIDKLKQDKFDRWRHNRQNPTQAGLYLYHNLPILHIHNYISYQIGRTDTDIYGWL